MVQSVGLDCYFDMAGDKILIRNKVLSKLTSHLFHFAVLLAGLSQQIKPNFQQLIRKNYVVNKVKK